jgi:DNA-binding response OmpR family regulator
MEVLIRNPGKVMSRDILTEYIWGTDFYGDTRTIDVHIRHLRKKIEENPSSPGYIMTIRGVGYKMQEK